VPVGVTEGVIVGDPLGVTVGVVVAEGLLVGVLDGVAVPVAVGVCVGVLVGLILGVLVIVTVGVEVPVGVSVGVSVGVLVGVSVGVALAATPAQVPSQNPNPVAVCSHRLLVPTQLLPPATPFAQLGSKQLCLKEAPISWQKLVQSLIGVVMQRFWLAPSQMQQSACAVGTKVKVASVTTAVTCNATQSDRRPILAPISPGTEHLSRG
jgi:hypothetical protein